MVIGVAGCVAQAEGEALLERAPFVDIVVGPQAYHRLPELLHRRARSQGGVLDTDFPLESKFDRLPEELASAAGRLRLPHRPGRLRQVLHLLRGALHPRRRGVAPGGGDPRRGAAPGRRPARARSPCSARTSTPITATGPTGEPWSLARLIRALAEIADLARIRYTTSHPARHGRRPDRGARQRRQADAVPASAGAVGLGCGAPGDEPAPHRRRLSAHRRAPARGAARPRPVVRFHRRLPGRDRARISRRRSRWSRRSASPRRSRSSTARGRARPAAGMRRQVADAVKSERLARLQALLAEQTRAFNDRSVGRVLPVLLERPGRHPGQLVGRTPYLQAVHVEAPASALGETDRCPDHRRVTPTAWPPSPVARRGGVPDSPLPRYAAMRLKPLSLEPGGVVSRTLRFDDNARCARAVRQASRASRPDRAAPAR